MESSRAHRKRRATTCHRPPRLLHRKANPKWFGPCPCDCTAGDRTERALQRARVPERYRHCDFENYETDNEI